MSEQGYYDVTLHTGPGIVQAHVTFPFGRWAELGFWLDDIAPGEQDVLTVTFHPVRPPVACTPEDVDESAGQAELHSIRHELHPVGGVDLDAVARLEAFSLEATPSTDQED